jgi:hypothetical protein
VDLSLPTSSRPPSSQKGIDLVPPDVHRRAGPRRARGSSGVAALVYVVLLRPAAAGGTTHGWTAPRCSSTCNAEVWLVERELQHQQRRSAPRQRRPASSVRGWTWLSARQLPDRMELMLCGGRRQCRRCG